MDFIKVSEAAKLLCVSESTVRVWEKDGLLRAVRTAKGQRLFKRADVEKLAPKEAVAP